MHSSLNASVISFCIHSADDFCRFHADRADPLQEVDDLFLVICKAVVVKLFSNRRVFGLTFLVVFENPFKGRAVAELVLPGGGWNAFQGRHAVQLYGAVSLVGLEDGFDNHGWLSGFRCFVHPFQGERIGLLVPEVKHHKLPAPGRPFTEVVVKGDAGEFPFEVEPVLLPIGGSVEDGVDVMDNIEAGDLFVFVFTVELLQRIVSNVVSAFALPVVTIEREALGFFKEIKRWNMFYC